MSKQVLDWLQRHSACEESVSWVRKRRFKTMTEVWSGCNHRPGWLLWILYKCLYQDLRYELFDLNSDSKFRRLISEVDMAYLDAGTPWYLCHVHLRGDNLLVHPPLKIRMTLCKKIRENFHPEGDQ